MPELRIVGGDPTVKTPSRLERWEDYGMHRVRIQLGAVWVRSRHGSGMIHAVRDLIIYRNLTGERRFQVRHIIVKFVCGGTGFDDRLRQVVINNVVAMGAEREQGKLCWRCELKVLGG